MMKHVLTISAAILAFSMNAQVEGAVIELTELEIVSSRYDEKAPFTVTNIDKKQITNILASRDIPEVLNTSPSIYATNQGGGAGDSRINVRGFNQRNVAIMINGVPVNDIENGWVYWSNWDGLGDATSNIQVQRGLSGVNLAVPSIGGTINIISDPAQYNKGGSVRQEVGSYGFLKTAMSLNSGRINDKMAISATLVRKTGDGFAKGTWTDAWAYYMGASYQVDDKNKLEAYVIGAPQRHGQNLYRQNIARYSHELADNMEGYDPAAKDDYKEFGRDFNQNYSPVDASYDGQQHFSMYNTTIGDRKVTDHLNERENFFHKPQINFNWYHTVNDDMTWSNIFYYSGGKGGGTGTYGSVKTDYGDGGGLRNWNDEIAQNRDVSDGSPASTGILRNSVNQQSTWGVISKLFHQVNDELKLTYGIDARTAKVGHWREVRDLLGGQYFNYTGNDFDTDAASQQKGLGDKVAYFNTNTVAWLGGYLQGNYESGPMTVNFMTGVTAASYSYTDHFRAAGADDMASENGEFMQENNNLPGVQFKGGVSYQINDELRAFVNGGWVKATPTYDKAINDNSGRKYEQTLANNETFQSVEVGMGWSAPNGILALSANYYNTLWLNRTRSFFVLDSVGAESAIYLQGMNANHSGIEIEASIKPMDDLRIDIGASFGDWVLLNDLDGEYTDYSSGAAVTTDVNYYVGGLHVGDAPQNQIMGSISYTGIKGLNARLSMRHYDKFFSDWNVFDRDDAAAADIESWEVPSFTLVDLNLNYRLPFDFNGTTFDAFVHVLNLTDALYIQDATDNSRYNDYDGDHDADDAEVFLGLPRRFNLGMKINF
ncbi:MAG: TonB-dependent receptor plug domain-containing protein [Proteobacteria bacterium]|nr:TonB-dependent receptor plug domain-containing protein [Pseudomonadota bacterium]